MTNKQNDIFSSNKCLINRHSATWWFVKVRLKFCVFVLLVLPCSSSLVHSSNTVFSFHNSQNQIRPNSSDVTLQSSLRTSLSYSVPKNHSQVVKFDQEKDIFLNNKQFDSSSKSNLTAQSNNNSSESTLFRRGREAHQNFIQRITPQRISPPPVPSLPPSRTHILQNKHKRPHQQISNSPHLSNFYNNRPPHGLIGSASSSSSTNLGLPESIANEFIDGVNPPQFFGKLDSFDHDKSDYIRTHNEPKKKVRPVSTTSLPKTNKVYVLPEPLPEGRPLDNNNYAPTPVRMTNDSINSILNLIRAKDKMNEDKQILQNQLKKHENAKNRPTTVNRNSEFESDLLLHQQGQMTPKTGHVSVVKSLSPMHSQNSSINPHSSMELELQNMIKQEYDAKNAELNQTILLSKIAIHDTLYEKPMFGGHLTPLRTTSVMPSRNNRDRYISGTPKFLTPSSTVVTKKITNRPTIKKNNSKNYQKVKLSRRPIGSVSSTTIASITTTEPAIQKYSQTPTRTNVRWEPPKEVSVPAPENNAETDIRFTSTTGNPINKSQSNFNDFDLNVDESRNDLGTNHSQIDWFAIPDNGRRRRVNLSGNDTLGSSIPISGSATFRLTTERLAYILIGSCCGLSLLCLVVVAMSVRCRDVCDDYQTWKTTDKRWQQTRLRPGAFMRPPGPQSFFPYPSTLLRATGVLPRYLRSAVMGEKPKMSDQPSSVNNINSTSNGQCCHCVNCSSTWFFRNVKQGDWCCQRGYLEPPKRNKLPFGAASTVNTFMATKDGEFSTIQEHETRPKRLVMQEEESEEDEELEEPPEDDEGDEVSTDFSNLFDSHHHMHMHYTLSPGMSLSAEQQSPGRNKLKPSQLEPFECSQHEQLRQKSDDSKPQEWGKTHRIMNKLHRRHQARREAAHAASGSPKARFAMPKQVNTRRQQQQHQQQHKSGVTKASSSHHKTRYKTQMKAEPNMVSFLHPPNSSLFEQPVLHHHFDPIVGPMVFNGRYPDLGPPPSSSGAHLHHLRGPHPGAMHGPNVSVIWNNNDSERLI